MYLAHALHDGSLWIVGACLVVLAGVVVGLFTRAGSEITSHPYTRPGSGGPLAADLPAEETGRAELEPVLRRRRRANRR